MTPRILPARAAVLTVAVLLAACQEAERPLGPAEAPDGAVAAGGGFDQDRLAGWFRTASPAVLELPGTVLADHDEARGRLLFGVERPEAAEAVRAVVRRLGIPEEAVAVEVMAPIHQLATLQDQVRPVQGGLQINFNTASGAFACTLGFNALHEAGASFITNSHCTARQGRPDGVAYYQPLEGVPGSFLGNEADDPRYFRFMFRGCPRGRKCRYSDAARVAYAEGVNFQLGRIAKTTGVNNGSLTIDGYFTITAENTATSFTVGETLNKVGRTSGWTQGEVTFTCVDVNVANSRITLLCQTIVAAGATAGDSGSPVFKITSGDNVTLYGILWGGDAGGTIFVFSPLGNVEMELGPLTTIDT